ncbi:uncharacterized protein LOC111780597 isoform X1 [Cucurbita pepo subsp. pepo]|uniref:uncharacterized protein LOC111780597 isoform X1 n=1 Tax=Cucurbita pepo subsp. pepo TaxID=3664 RepID=UPI000C9D8C80|nr:uncharacterized protein LOC111780597 isoform X1 [Cucurbita pepo subsp. pepo]
MESGRRIEADESKTQSISNSGEVGLSIPRSQLLTSLSSASYSSTDSSFELIVTGNGDFICRTSDSLDNNEFQFISGDESSLRDHLIEHQRPGKYTDGNAMEPDLNKPGEAGDLGSRKNLQTYSSTSSSFESESKHKIKLKQGRDATDNLLSNNPSSPSMEKFNRFVVDFSDEDVPISSMPSNRRTPVTPKHRIDLGSGSEAAIKYPPIQVMDRTDDPTSISYRIPSRVFSRSKSTAPMEWSVASNESLFSIQMGNMSFTREQLGWLGKSGELYRPGESALDVSQHLAMRPSDYGLIGTHPDGDMAATEARAAETMREVIRESSENQRKTGSTLTESSSQSASISPQSESSTKSFQFPILTGDAGKSMSFKGGNLENAKQEGTPESPRPSSCPQTPKESSSEGSPKAAANVGSKRWPCFSCCPFCS